MSTIPNACAFDISRTDDINALLEMIPAIINNPVLTLTECNELLDQANARIKFIGAKLSARHSSPITHH
jgi:hypothetical protein